MTTRRTVKGSSAGAKRTKVGRPVVVGVIASPGDLSFALRMKKPPDLFELRLDCLCHVLNRLEQRLSILPAPKIITARDPREGGANNLSIEQRRELLSRFLRHAKFVDVELSSARALKPLLAQARQRNRRVILSFHDLRSTPSSRSLRAKATLAKKYGADIFKVATRMDKSADLARLIDFVITNETKIDISAMGIGKLGGISRLLLARCGSVLNYAALHQPILEGQLSIDTLRSALPR